MKPVLLFRKEFASKYELRFAEKHFPIEESRVNCRDGLVVGRYSVEPFHHELEHDLSLIGSRLVNSGDEHRWITSFDYYGEVKDHTPETWDDGNIHRCTHEGPFVVKGKTKSKKHRWNTQMFAKTKRDAIAVGDRLKEEGDLQDQGVVYRKYVPLKTYDVGPNGLPYTNEWRFFYFKQRLLSRGYYWSEADCFGEAEFKPAAQRLADKLAQVTARFTSFYTMDLAETQGGDWILIEINDAQMAVPSENDLDELYGNLREAVGQDA